MKGDPLRRPTYSYCPWKLKTSAEIVGGSVDVGAADGEGVAGERHHSAAFEVVGPLGAAAELRAAVRGEDDGAAAVVDHLASLEVGDRDDLRLDPVGVLDLGVDRIDHPLVAQLPGDRPLILGELDPLQHPVAAAHDDESGVAPARQP